MHHSGNIPHITMMKGSLVNTAVLTRLPFVLRCGMGRYSKKKMILYDRGGKKFALYSRTGLVNTIDMENMIYAGDLAENGNYAVATGASEYAAQIIAFNKNDEEIFRFSSKEPIIDFTLSDNRNSMAVATVDVQDGQFKSTLSQYQFNVEQKLNSFDLMDELILSVEALENNMIRIITDKRAILMDDNLKELSDVSYNNKPLDRIAGELGSRLVFVLGSYDQQKELSCEVYDQWLNLLGEFPIDHSITDICLLYTSSNGSASVTAEKLFGGLGARCHILNCTPDGKNINQGCGSTHMELSLIHICKASSNRNCRSRGSPCAGKSGRRRNGIH